MIPHKVFVDNHLVIDKNHYNVLNQSRQAQVLSLLQLQTLHQQNYQRYVLKNGSEKVLRRMINRVIHKLTTRIIG